MHTNRRRKNENKQNGNADRMGTNVYSSKDNQSMHKSLNGEFILYQILLEQISDKKQALKFNENNLVEYFQPDDTNDIQVMKEFNEEYKSEKAIYWYTRETCIYKILNKALRTQDIDDIIPFGSFIRDLNKQLRKEHKLFINQQNTSNIKVYRGQFISKDEVNRLKSSQQGLISMNSFLSTSTNRNKALEFATSRSPPNDELTSILLEIDVNLNYLSKPYADIKRLSAFPEEEEILFMVGSVFRIDDISRDDKINLWIAKLTLCSLDDPDIKDFSLSLKQELNDQNEFVAIGNYFVHMLKYDLAQEHFQKILDQNLVKEDIDFAYCYYGLAQVNCKNEDYHLAISNIHKALEYLLNNSSLDNHSLLSLCYNDLGSIYANQSNYVVALQFFDKALSKNDNNKNLSKIYITLSDVHFKMTNYHMALEYLKKSLDYQSETEYSIIANTYINMGKIYVAINESEKASKIFDKAIEYQLKELPDTHPDVAYTYNAIGLMFFDKNDHEKALEYVEKAHQLQLESIPNNHPDFADTYRNFADIYKKKGDLDKALFYYEKVLENQLKTLLLSNPSVVDTYRSIGNIHREKQNYDQASIYFHKILDSQLERTKLGDKSISNAYQNLGDFFLEKLNLDDALHFYLELLNNELITKLSEDFSLTHVYKTIANIYYKKRVLDQSLIYYNRLLDCYLQKESFDQSTIDEIYTFIGQVYLKKRRFDQTLVFYQKQNNNQPLHDKSTDKHKIIDNIFFEKRHLEQSFHYFKKHLHKQLKTHSEKDPLLVDTYNILANISFEKDNFDEALKYFLLLLNNELERKQIHDSSLQNIFKAIATIYFEQENYNQSLIYYHKLIDCQLQKKPNKHSSIDDTYTMIGKIYLKKKYFHLHSNDSKKLMKNKFNKNLPMKVSKTTTQSHTDNFLLEKRHLDQALFYFQNLITKQINNQSLDDIYTILGNICLEKQDFNQALSFFQTLLNKQLQQNSFGDASLVNTYLIIGNIYAQISNFNQALQHYRQGLSICRRLPTVDQSIGYEIKSRIRDLPVS
ncbi:unnamed protein product [Rotaria sp. Silwood1]|nr:unnamed protein product [Rotaria sp. Silwood1]CAF1497510.1 unnamed protein product [Rotaria sp. Silwood1]CAF3553807.1 unnamed protein product [Rotaria sp. Silwood1]CAF4731335.1 unnamed protein product [Rotaria sp. Silwood1]